MYDIAPRRFMQLWQAVEQCSQSLGQIHHWTHDGGRAEFWPGADMHPVPTFVLCLQGTARCLRAASGHQHAVDLQVGDILLIDAGVCHQHVDLRADHTVLQLGFLPQCCDYWFLIGQQQFNVRLPMQPYRLYMDEASRQPDQTRHELEHLLRTLLDEERHEPFKLSPALHKMKRYLEQNAHQPIRAEDIVAASGLRHSQAYEIFVAYYQAPPFQVLQQRRCDIAVAQLQSGVDAATCAEASGFANQRAMQRALQRFRPDLEQ